MKILEWSGEIGWELWLPELRAQLKNTKGDDITIRFSSIGGSIFEGGDIFNMLADHRRDNPGIKMNLEIKGIAASMGSAIASSPVWDEILVEPISMFMIHNPWTFAMGDYKAMQSEADFLKSARDMYMNIYSKKSGIDNTEIGNMMDSETWLFGQEIIDAGFADKINEAVNNDPVDKVVSLRNMKVKFSEMKKRQQELHKDEGFDKDKAAACLRIADGVQTTPRVGMVIPGDEPDKTNKPGHPGNLKTEVPNVENKKELMKELPDVYDESVNDGVMKERGRVKAIAEIKDQEEYKDIPEVQAVLDKAITEGTELDAVQPLIMATMVKILKDPKRVGEIEGPGDIQGDDTQTEMSVEKEKVREV